MEYPKEILPKVGHAFPFPIDELISQFGNFCLCYRLKGKLDDHLEEGTFMNRKILKTSAFEHPIGLSNNLLGGGFLPDYVVFQQKKPANDKWDGKTEVSYESIRDSIDTIDAVPIFFSGEAIHRKSFQTYNVTFPDSNAYKSFKNIIRDKKLPDYSDGLTINIESEMRVRHVPTLSNYWHVQLEIHPEGIDQFLKKDDGVWRSRIYKHLKENILTRQFKTEPVCNICIPKEMYVAKAH